MVGYCLLHMRPTCVKHPGSYDLRSMPLPNTVYSPYSHISVTRPFRSDHTARRIWAWLAPTRWTEPKETKVARSFLSLGISSKRWSFSTQYHPGKTIHSSHSVWHNACGMTRVTMYKHTHTHTHTQLLHTQPDWKKRSICGNKLVGVGVNIIKLPLWLWRLRLWFHDPDFGGTQDSGM